MSNISHNKETDNKQTMNDLKLKVSKYLTIICNECSKLFSTPAGLAKHKKIVHERECHSCNQCFEKFALKDYLNNHYNAVHLGKKFPCNHCTYSSGYKTNLQKHMNSIHKGQKIPCNICSSRGALTAHNRAVHLKLRKYKASVKQERISSEIKKEKVS